MRLPLALAIGCVALFASQVDAQDTPTKREEEALAQAAKKLEKVAQAAQEKSPAVARKEFERAFALSPSAASRDGLAKLPWVDGPDPSPPAELETEIKTAHDECATLLADAAAACDKDNQVAGFERLATLIHALDLSKTELDRIGAVWFEPYLRCVRKDDAAKLEAGGELVDGKWLEKAAVAEQDKKHASWATPWVLSDEVHELRTTVPHRTAREILAYIGVYRRFFLSLFPDWDLKTPGGKLLVIVTETQKDFVERLKIEQQKTGGVEAPPHQAAIYLHFANGRGPCLATYEPAFSGQPVKVTLKGVLLALRHELAHQIAFEFSKHAATRGREAQSQLWCIEGLGRFMESWVLEKGRWRLSRTARFLLVGNQGVEGAYAYCQEHKDKLPPLDALFALDWNGFFKEQLTLHYNHAATAFDFLWEGEGGRYRSGLVKLVETVHRNKDSGKTWSTCFPNVDRKALQEQFSKYVDGLKIEPER